MFTALLKTTQRLLWRSTPSDAHVLCSLERMQALLARERARTDRTGDPLSLVVILPRTSESRQPLADFLTKFSASRLRCTDDVGWLDESRLAILLPGSTAAGGLKVAEDLCKSCPEELPPPICTVYCHPSPSSDTNGLDSPDLADDGLTGDEEALPLDQLFMQQTPTWKRCADIVGAGLTLILVSPLLLCIALAIKLTSRGPVLFCQWRSGLGGKPFLMYKFRTMQVDAEAQKAALRALSEQDGPAFKMKRDPRVTRLGQFLRTSSLDELPQLWNIVLGDMSLVGPRPLPCDESNNCLPWQKRRLSIKPGLTCIWQVRGRSRVTFEEWIRMDLRYIRTQSFFLDVLLLVLTVPAVLLRRGAH